MVSGSGEWARNRAVCHALPYAARMSAIVDDWITPEWPAPARVRALCTTRTGGVSAPPWDTCNLGDHVGDDARSVAANRRVLHAAMQGGGAPVRAVYLNQVHGADAVLLDGASRDGQAFDACATQGVGVACTILVADCLPVLFTNRAGTCVAAAHAGWRGLAQGVLERTLACLRQAVPGGDEAADILAWLGPCIGPQAFEVGAEVRQAFCAHDAQAARGFVPAGTPGKYLADLALLARQRLGRAGVAHIHGNDGTPPWCTFSQPSRFFSHRRDAVRLGASGRMAACIWLGA